MLMQGDDQCAVSFVSFVALTDNNEPGCKGDGAGDLEVSIGEAVLGDLLHRLELHLTVFSKDLLVAFFEL